MLAAAQPSISSSSRLPLRHYESLPLYNESTPYMEKELVHRQEVGPGGLGLTNRGMRRGEKGGGIQIPPTRQTRTQTYELLIFIALK